MAITILNNLYPPLIENSYMPAFIYTGSCKIYFSLPQYNNRNDLHSNYPAQVTIRKVKTNQNVLSTNLYPSGIKLCQITEVNSTQLENKYYIQLNSSDIQGGFSLNEYYQVQIRFTGNAAAAPPSSGIGIDSWLSNNLSYFSEWSTIVLIYSISTLSLNLRYYKINQNNINTDSSLRAIISGKLTFAVNGDKEILKSYRVLLQQQNNAEIIYEDSGLLYPTNINQLFYKIKYNIIQKKYYKVVIEIETKNGYTFSSWFNYKWEPIQRDIFEVKHKIITDNENGGIRVKLLSKKENSINSNDEIRFVYDKNNDCLIGKAAYLTIGNSSLGLNTAGIGDYESWDFFQEKYKIILINSSLPIFNLPKGIKVFIQRTSSRDNFSVWTETIAAFEIKEDDITELLWDDYTVEPGVWYKYKIIVQDSQGEYTEEMITDKGMVYTNHIFLTTKEQQLKICYDPQISNFSIKTADSLIETIGSQYPYIRRQGNLYYKTFSLSGTISYLSDVDSNLFNSSKDKLYLNNEITQLYNQYNQKNNIGIYNDFVREKEFRNAVINFLYNDDVKLFRSLTQGNLLVKIINVTLVPKTELGRMIYSFSCTLCEIASPIEENLINNNDNLYRKQEVPIRRR